MNQSKNTFECYLKELADAERFGLMAVRTTVDTGLEKWKDDWAKLAQISDFLISQGNLADCRKDNELTGTYLLLIHQTWDFAEEHLSQVHFHDFCNYSLRNRHYAMYADLAVEILQDL